MPTWACRCRCLASAGRSASPRSLSSCRRRARKRDVGARTHVAARLRVGGIHPGLRNHRHPATRRHGPSQERVFHHYLLHQGTSVSGFSRTRMTRSAATIGLALLPRESEAPGPDTRCEAARDRPTRGHLLRHSSSLGSRRLLARSGVRRRPPAHGFAPQHTNPTVGTRAATTHPGLVLPSQLSRHRVSPSRSSR